jgi:hypothetical protein
MGLQATRERTHSDSTQKGIDEMQPPEIQGRSYLASLVNGLQPGTRQGCCSGWLITFIGRIFLDMGRKTGYLLVRGQ